MLTEDLYIYKVNDRMVCCAPQHDANCFVHPGTAIQNNGVRRIVLSISWLVGVNTSQNSIVMNFFGWLVPESVVFNHSPICKALRIFRLESQLKMHDIFFFANLTVVCPHNRLDNPTFFLQFDMVAENHWFSSLK